MLLAGAAAGEAPAKAILVRLYWSKGAHDEAEPLYQEALRVMEPLHQEPLRIKARRSPCTRRLCGFLACGPSRPVAVPPLAPTV